MKLKYIGAFAFALLATLGTSTHAVTQAELDAMMSNVRKIVTDVGSDKDVQNFDKQMDEARRLSQQSEATRIDTARVRAESAEAEREGERRNARARFENASQAAQEKQNDLNRNPPKGGQPILQHKRDECWSCR